MRKHKDLNDYEAYGRDCLAGTLPACSCACPLNIDIRGIVNLIQRDNFTAAYKLYRDQSVFPGIVSLLCNAPCRQACVRSGKDDGLQIPLIERALVENTASTTPPKFNLPRKASKIAVVGGGLAGLTCALRLGSKRYDVTLYEQSDRLGGRILSPTDHLDDKTRPQMDPDFILTEIETQMQFAHIDYRMNTTIESLAQLEFDAAFIATGGGGATFGLVTGEASDRSGFNRQSFGTSHPGVFLGGALLGANPVADIGQAIIAAHAIEKYLKTGRMDGIPESFMETESKLTMDLSHEPTLPFMPSKAKFTKEAAITEVGRCLKCDCRLCKDACELFGYFQKKPLQIIGEAFASIHSGQGSITKQSTTQLISSCTLCGLCGKVCPKGIDIGKTAYDFRHFKHQNKRYPKGYSDFYIRDMIFSNTEASLIRAANGALKPPCHSCADEKIKASAKASANKGAKHVMRAFFPGCQLGADNPEYVTSAYRYLLEQNDTTAIMIGCCGAPADWGAEETLNDQILNDIHQQWESLGRPELICACPTCMQQFAQFLPEISCTSLYELIAEGGLPASAAAMPNSPVSIFDPCTSRAFPRMQQSVRTLVAMVGAVNEELPFHGETAKCCGIGAHTLSANAKFAEVMIQNRINENNNLYINYCTNCRDTFTMWEKNCCHILDLVFGFFERGYSIPTLNERRHNKLETRRRVLSAFFGEEIPVQEEDPFETNVIISSALQKKLRKKLILEQEIHQTIKFCEETANKLYDEKRDLFIGHLKIGHITYWVEYKTEPSRTALYDRNNMEAPSSCVGTYNDSHNQRFHFVLLNAYTHRMEILEEEGRDG